MRHDIIFADRLLVAFTALITILAIGGTCAVARYKQASGPCRDSITTTWFASVSCETGQTLTRNADGSVLCTCKPAAP
jgi:hypothetical protein